MSKNKKNIKGYMKVKPWMLKDFSEIEKALLVKDGTKIKVGKKEFVLYNAKDE